MSTPYLKPAALFAGVVLAIFCNAASAHHFRGAALVPSVSATGLLTITATSFWRAPAPGNPIVPFDVDDGLSSHDNPVKVDGALDPVVRQGGTTTLPDP